MSAAFAAAAATAASTAAASYRNHKNNTISTSEIYNTSIVHHHHEPLFNNYATQKRRDWNSFLQYLHHRTPPLDLSQCRGAQVIEFLDQFRNNKVHNVTCPFIDCRGSALSSCPCPVQQADWAGLNKLIGRLFVAYGNNGGLAEKNPFDERIVQLYLLEVKESQAKAEAKAREIAECRNKPHEMMGGRPPNIIAPPSQNEEKVDLENGNGSRGASVKSWSRE